MEDILYHFLLGCPHQVQSLHRRGLGSVCPLHRLWEGFILLPLRSFLGLVLFPFALPFFFFILRLRHQFPKEEAWHFMGFRVDLFH